MYRRNPKIRDVDYREMPGIPGSTSLRKAWEIMRDQKIDTLPITSADNELEGIITVKDIATANMDVFDTGVLATSRTTYKKYPRDPRRHHGRRQRERRLHHRSYQNRHCHP